MMWLIILGFIALIVAAIWLGAEWQYRQDWFGLLYIPWLILAWLLCLFTYNLNLDYQTNKCAQWSQTTGYETKYVNIGYGDWDCYGLLDDKWIPIDRIRGIEE